MTIKIQFPSSRRWITFRALVDSGCQGNFINKKLIRKYLMSYLPKESPLTLTLADGGNSRGGNVTHYEPVLMKIGEHIEAIAFDITPTAHDIVLGIPWLNKHDPSISW